MPFAVTCDRSPTFEQPPLDADQQLLERFTETGDHQHLVELCRRHLDGCYRLASRLGQSVAPEDVLQESFIELMRCAGRYRPTGTVRSWLLAITANTHRRLMRSESRRRRREVIAAQQMPFEPEQPSQDCEAALSALSALPERYRLPVAMRYLDDLSFTDIAAALRCREKSARSLVSRGLEKMRVWLAKSGHPVPVGAIAILLAERQSPAAPAQASEAIGVAARIAPTAAASSSVSLIAVAMSALAIAGLLFGGWLWRRDARPSPPSHGDDQHAMDPYLASILAQTIDAEYEYDYLSNVLTDISKRTGLLVALPQHVDRLLVKDLKEPTIKVGDLIDRLAAEAHLVREYRGLTLVLWQPAEDAVLRDLERQLRTGDVQKRCEAAFEMSRLSDPRIYPLLFEALSDPDPAVVFWTIGHPELGSDQTCGLFRHLSAFGFGEGIGKAVDRLREIALSSPVDLDRLAAVCLIALSRDERSLRILDEITQRFDFLERGISLSPFMKSLAAERMLPKAVAAEFLMHQLESEDVGSKAALRQLRGSQILRHPDLAMLRQRVDALMPMPATSSESPPDIDALIAQLRADDTASEAFSLSAKLAFSKDKRAIAAVAERIRAGTSFYASSFVNHLAYSYCPDATDALLALLDDDKPKVRCDVMSYLPTTRDPRAIDRLLTAFDDQDKSVRICAMSALAHFSEKRALEALSAMARPGSPDRVEALRALAGLLDPRAARALIAALSDPDAKVREIGSRTTFQNMRDPRAVPGLMALARSQDATERASVAGSLPYFCGLPGVEEICIKLTTDDDEQVRGQMLFHLSCCYCGSKAVLDHYLALLSHGDPSRRAQAIAVCARLRDPRAIKPLIDMLSDADEKVRRVSRSALEEFVRIEGGIPVEQRDLIESALGNPGEKPTRESTQGF